MEELGVQERGKKSISVHDLQSPGWTHCHWSTPQNLIVKVKHREKWDLNKETAFTCWRQSIKETSWSWVPGCVEDSGQCLPLLHLFSKVLVFLPSNMLSWMGKKTVQLWLITLWRLYVHEIMGGSGNSWKLGRAANLKNKSNQVSYGTKTLEQLPRCRSPPQPFAWHWHTSLPRGSTASIFLLYMLMCGPSHSFPEASACSNFVFFLLTVTFSIISRPSFRFASSHPLPRFVLSGRSLIFSLHLFLTGRIIDPVLLFVFKMWLEHYARY